MAKCKDAFDISVPIKLKYLRSNQIPSMNKKIILDRTRKRNRFLRTRSDGINSGTSVRLLFVKLSKTTTATLVIGKFPIIDHF